MAETDQARKFLWGIAQAVIGAGAIAVMGVMIGNSSRLADKVDSINTQVVSLAAWKQQVETQNSVPRQEIELRQQMINAQIEQLRLRVNEVEARARQ